MKKEVKRLDGTPSKRLYWSIISDYGLQTAICELVDNALDIWLKNGKSSDLRIAIELDCDRQTISIADCAGGVPEENLAFLITPGAGNNSRDENIIGIFGVGSKRAVVALAEDIRIRSRYMDQTTFQIDIDNSWLENESWDLPAYQVQDIEAGTTRIELSRLRIKIDAENEKMLKDHLSEVYGLFLDNPKFEISLNRQKLKAARFDCWAFPPEFEPRCLLFELQNDDSTTVGVDLTAGLISSKEPGREDYGVYFYCNERLIQKEIKSREVGYFSGKAGLPHSDASLARIVVRLHGATKHMPWNSSKSAVNFGHATFHALQEILVSLVADYTSLSRRFKGQWDDKVFAFPTGKIEHIDVDAAKTRRSYLPPLPKTYRHKVDVLKTSNKDRIKDAPWTLGLVEAVAAVDLMRKQSGFATRNRIALLLLDSSFEIGLKEFIVHRQDLNLNGRTLEQVFANRSEVIKVVSQKVPLDTITLTKINHYYLQRNKLVHERATVEVTDADIENYSQTVQKVLSELFGLQFH